MTKAGIGFQLALLGHVGPITVVNDSDTDDNGSDDNRSTLPVARGKKTSSSSSLSSTGSHSKQPEEPGSSMPVLTRHQTKETGPIASSTRGQHGRSTNGRFTVEQQTGRKRSTSSSLKSSSSSSSSQPIEKKPRHQHESYVRTAPVEQYNIKTGKTIARFEKQKDAAEATGINASKISQCRHGEIDEAGGFGWRDIGPTTTAASSVSTSLVKRKPTDTKEMKKPVAGQLVDRNRMDRMPWPLRSHDQKPPPPPPAASSSVPPSKPNNGSTRSSSSSSGSTSPDKLPQTRRGGYNPAVPVEEVEDWPVYWSEGSAASATTASVSTSPSSSSSASSTAYSHPMDFVRDAIKRAARKSPTPDNSQSNPTELNPQQSEAIARAVRGFIIVSPPTQSSSSSFSSTSTDKISPSPAAQDSPPRCQSNVDALMLKDKDSPEEMAPAIVNNTHSDSHNDNNNDNNHPIPPSDATDNNTAMTPERLAMIAEIKRLITTGRYASIQIPQENLDFQARRIEQAMADDKITMDKIRAHFASDTAASSAAPAVVDA